MSQIWRCCGCVSRPAPPARFRPACPAPVSSPRRSCRPAAGEHRSPGIPPPARATTRPGTASPAGTADPAILLHSLRPVLPGRRPLAQELRIAERLEYPLGRGVERTPHLEHMPLDHPLPPLSGHSDPRPRLSSEERSALPGPTPIPRTCGTSRSTPLPPATAPARADRAAPAPPVSPPAAPPTPAHGCASTPREGSSRTAPPARRSASHPHAAGPGSSGGPGGRGP